MSVPMGKRSKGHLEVSVKARDLAEHTVRIVSNPNVFDPRFRMFADRVVNLAVGIGEKIWRANGIYVGNNPHNWQVRHRLQQEACYDLDTLIYLIGLSRKLYHLRSRKAEHWARLAAETRDLARKWRDSDARRYGYLASGM